VSEISLVLLVYSAASCSGKVQSNAYVGARQSHSLVRGDECTVSSTNGNRTAGDRRRHSYAGLFESDLYLRVNLDRQIDNFINAGSGWTLTAILWFVIRIGQFRPLVGSSFIPTPKSLEVKKALVSVYNPDDNMCFAWAVLPALYPCQQNTERVSKYLPI
jgi:hypothetical protein